MGRSMIVACFRAPRGWRCTKGLMHEGPCPAVPVWWNHSRFARRVRGRSKRL